MITKKIEVWLDKWCDGSYVHMYTDGFYRKAYIFEVNKFTVERDRLEFSSYDFTKKSVYKEDNFRFSNEGYNFFKDYKTDKTKSLVETKNGFACMNGKIEWIMYRGAIFNLFILKRKLKKINCECEDE